MVIMSAWLSKLFEFIPRIIISCLSKIKNRGADNDEKSK